MTSPRTKPAQPSLEQQLAEEKATVARLERMIDEIADEEADAWRRGAASPVSAASNAREKIAEAFLAGLDVVHRPSADEGRPLSLTERVDGLQLALGKAKKRLSALMIDWADAVEREMMPAYRDHVRKVLTLIEALRELARDRREFLDAWAKKTGVRPCLPGFDLADTMLDLNDDFSFHGDGLCGRLIEVTRDL